MSRLQLHGRPWVVFNAKNKEHREWFAEFNKSAKWGTCPVRFVVNEDHGDLITQIQRELIQFYVDREFGTAENPRVRSVAKKPQKSKLKEVVDGLTKRAYN